MDRTTLLDLALTATHKWAAALAAPPPEKKIVKLSEKGQKIQDLVNTRNFGCKSELVAKTMSILLDEEILPPKEQEPNGPAWGLFTVVVPLSNPNSHSYTIGVPYMAVHASVPSGNMISSGGYQGNNMSQILGSVRPATDEEIGIFVDKLVEGAFHLTTFEVYDVMMASLKA